MNTHLLIPIKDIENQIKNLMNSKIENQINGVRISILQNILKGKQISLDGKDTETKAFLNAPTDSPEEPAYPNHSDTDIFIVGYKQALKDLL